MLYLFKDSGGGTGTLRSSCTSSKFFVLNRGVASKSLSSTILRGKPLLIRSSACFAKKKTKGAKTFHSLNLTYESA